MFLYFPFLMNEGQCSFITTCLDLVHNKQSSELNRLDEVRFRSGTLPDSSPLGRLFVQDELLWVDVVEVPFEALALEPLLDGLPVGHVANVLDDGGVPVEVLPVHVEEALVVVHPDLGHARGVDAVGVLGDEVGVPRAEYVAHVRAGHVLHAAAASPGAKRELCRSIDGMYSQYL